MRRLVQPFVAALAAVVALLIMAAPGVAEARWLRAESAHFVIYSDGDEAGLREYVRRLEIYDAVLRSRTGVSADAIKRANNLWNISRQVYGDGARWTTIYEANKDQIRDPRIIHPGQVFILPEGNAEWAAEDTGAR